MDRDPAEPTVPHQNWDQTGTLGQPAPVSGPSIPVRIGNYRIIRLLGEGGMGAVYEAEQDNPKRTVAFKVIWSSLAIPSLLRRFEQESQALARLHHPGIAQVYEAGKAEAGAGLQPFFAMEFIAGGQTSPSTPGGSPSRLRLTLTIKYSSQGEMNVHGARCRPRRKPSSPCRTPDHRPLF
jgi:serine/threonine protein kinase